MPKDVAIQRIDRYTLKVFSEEDADEIADFPKLKILRAKITGARHPRSYEQLQTYHCACRTVAENTSDPDWNTQEKVDFQVKVKCRLIDSFLQVDGTLQIIPGSVSYDRMGHLKACNFFDRAFDEMGKHLGITRDELLANVNTG